MEPFNEFNMIKFEIHSLKLFIKTVGKVCRKVSRIPTGFKKEM